jgi:hypothetical protein
MTSFSAIRSKASKSQVISITHDDEAAYEAAAAEAAAAAGAADETPATTPSDQLAKKRKAEPAKKAAAVVVRAAPPPRYEFDHLTLGGRPLPADRGHFRAVFENAKVIGDVLGSLAGLASMFPITFEPSGMSVRLLDGANVIYFVVSIPASSFLVYENMRDSKTTIVVSSTAFQSRKSQFSVKSTLTFAFQTVLREAQKLFVQLYPRSGEARDGLVTRFDVPLSDAEYDTLQERDDSEDYQYQVTISHALLMQIVGYFKVSMGEVAFTVTAHSLDLGGRCDENSQQTIQVHFIDGAAESRDIDVVAAALAGSPDTCHCARLMTWTPDRAPNVVNFRLSLVYLRRALTTLAGCRYVQLSLGRSFANFGGEFSPARLRGVYASPETGRAALSMTIYISPKIESEG